MASAQALNDERMDPPAGNECSISTAALARAELEGLGREGQVSACSTVGVVHATQQF